MGLHDPSGTPQWAAMNEWESDSPVPAIGSQSGSPSAPAVDPSLYTPPMARPIPFVQHSPEPTARRGDPLLADPPQSAAGGSVYAHWLARQTPSAPLPPNSATSAAPIQVNDDGGGFMDDDVMIDDRSWRPPTPTGPPAPAQAPIAVARPRTATYEAAPRHAAGAPPPAPHPHAPGNAPPRGAPVQAWQSNERPASSREAPREGERHRRDDTANRQRHGRPSSAPAQAQNKPPTAALRQLDNSASGTRNEAPAVRMTKSEAWARMAAYEACWQVCLQAVASGRKEAECFLLDSCSLLKDAFGLGPLTLRIGSGPSEAAPTLQPHQVETPVVLEDDPDCAASSRMPSKESAAKETRESLRIEVLRIKDKRRRGKFLSAWSQPSGENAPDLRVTLRPRSRPEASAVSVRPNQAGGGSSLVLGPQEAAEDLVLELWDGAELMGKGSVPISALWDSLEEVETILLDVHGNIEKLIAGQDLKERLRMMVAKLVRKAAGRQDPAILGAIKNGDGGAQHKLQVHSPEGVYVGKIVFGLWRAHGGPGCSAEEPMAKRSRGEDTSKWTVGPCQAYDTALAAALRNLGCGPRQLEVTHPWDWLLRQFAKSYGVSTHYAALAHLRWAVDPSNATPTADCFGVLLSNLSAVVRATGTALSPNEKEVFRAVCRATERLVARALENYRLLDESVPSGVAEPDSAPSQTPAPALEPAVGLFCLLRDPLSPTDQQWFKERLQTSARRRYMRMEANVGHGLRGGAVQPQGKEGKAGAKGGVLRPKTNAVGGAREGLLDGADSKEGSRGGETAVMSREYKQLELLAAALVREMEGDMRVHHSKVLPEFVHLPALVAEEHCRELVAKLQAVLKYRAPPQPTPGAVRMLVSVGRLQEFMARAGVLPPRESPAHLDARRIFQGHVLRWIVGSKASLVAACGATEGVSNGGQENAGKEGEVVPLTPPAPSGGHGGRPMCAVAEALPRLVEGELGKYKDVVVHWPLFGPSVEAAGCSVVRAGLKLMARNYGGAPSALRKAQSKPMAKAAKGLARTIRNGVRGDQGLHAGEVDGRGLPRVTENEAKVLNSLKVLLQWVGEWERVLVEWCGGRPEGVAEEGGQVRPVLGQQLGQVKKELRSEYSAAVKNAVERLSSAIFRQRELSIRAVLKEAKESDSMTEQHMERSLSPFFSAASDVLESCSARILPRAHVSVLRGMWDSACREMYEFVVNLTERTSSSGSAWKGRQAAEVALVIVDNFFKQLISKLHGGLSKDNQRDFDLPLHSDSCHKLLSNGGNLRESFTVY